MCSLKVVKVVLPSLPVKTFSVLPFNVANITTTPTYQCTNPASKHAVMCKSVFSTSDVNTSPASAVITLNSYLPLHVCDVPVPKTYNVTFVKCLHPYLVLKMSPPYPHFMLSFITLLVHVILNFQLTKMILAFNVFSIFNLITLNYMKCYINLSWRLTNYIN